MKKIISILMILLVVLSVAALPVSAVEAAQTDISVKKGDEVIYTLKLTTPEKVVGCDFSIYFDSSVLRVKEVADFTGNFDSEEHMAIINSNLKDQIIGNFSILSGIRFKDSLLVSVKFEAQTSADTDISYYVRYLYPESMQMFTEYTFTCDVTVNGKAVIEDAAPELNVDEPQQNGQFINSVTGDGKDADVNTAEDKPETNSPNNEPGENDTPKTPGNTKATEADDKDNDKETDADSNNDATTPQETSVSTQGGADAPASVVATPSQTDEDGGVFSSIWFWVVIAIVVIGGAFVVYKFVLNKKKETDTAETTQTKE